MALKSRNRSCICARKVRTGYQQLANTLVFARKSQRIIAYCRQPSLAEPISLVAQTPGAITYASYYYCTEIFPRLNTQLLAIDGVTPTPENILAKQYPYTLTLYTVTRADLPVNCPAAILRDWLISQDGQRVLKMSGYLIR